MRGWRRHARVISCLRLRRVSPVALAVSARGAGSKAAYRYRCQSQTFHFRRRTTSILSSSVDIQGPFVPIEPSRSARNGC